MARDECARQGSRVQTTFLEMHERARHARLITPWRHRDLSRSLQVSRLCMGVSAARRVTSAFKACPTRIRRLRGGSRPPRTRKQMLSTRGEQTLVADPGECAGQPSRSDRVEAAAICSIPPRHDPIVWLTGTHRSQRDCGCACGPPITSRRRSQRSGPPPSRWYAKCSSPACRDC